MVTPQDFIEVADHLLQSGTEAADRSSASRAYYGAFWYARRVVENNIGPIESSGPEVHSEVTRMLELWNPDAADALTDLRKARNLADYDASLSFDRGRAVDSLLVARWLVSNA